MVGDASSLLAPALRVEGVSWVAGSPPASPIEARIRIRYRHEGAAGRIAPQGGSGAEISFLEPVRAVSPGQAAVFYAGDEVLGGGWIARADA